MSLGSQISLLVGLTFVRIIVTSRHEEGNPEASFCDSLSESGEARSIEWKRAADENVKHHAEALRDHREEG